MEHDDDEKDPQSDRSPEALESLTRALAVLEIIDEKNAPMSASEVSRESGISLPIVLRLLRSLTELGQLEYDSRRYWISDGSLGLSWSYLSALDVESVLRPALSAAARRLQLPGFFSVLSAPHVYYVDRVQSQYWHMLTAGRVARTNAHVSAAGLVILAELSPGDLSSYLADFPRPAFTERSVVEADALRARLAEVREEQFAISDVEFIPDLRGAAVPVRNAQGQVIGAFSISTNSARNSLEELRSRVRDELTAAALEAQAKYRANVAD